MRLVTAIIALVIAAVASQIAIASVLARGESVVAVAGGEAEPALEWDIAVVGGSPSTDHITLAPIAIGVQGEFTVAVSGSRATLTLTTDLPDDRELASVGCLDNLFPPTEINPPLDRVSFTFDIVPGRTYRCFVSSLPIGVAAPAQAPADATAQPTDPLLPRSDAATPTSAPSPGWLTVVVALAVILGVALVLRPVRR